MTPAEAAALVRPRDRLAVPLGPGQPPAFLHALGERDDFEDLRVFGALLTGLYEVFTRRGVSLRSGFFGPVERGLRSSGHDVEFVPADFRRFSRIVRDFHPRILAVQAAMPDEKGMVSFGLHAGAGIEELFAVTRDPDRLLVVEVNPGIPRTVGLPPEHPHAIALDAIDVIIESDAPVFTIGDPEPTAVERAIAEIVAGYVPDGATIQTGIGGIPSAVAGILASGPGGDYGIHTEMFTNGCLALHRAGKVTNRKGVFDGHSIVTFAAGTREVYDYLDGNEDVRFLPVELVNDPAIISRNRRMVSINGALAVDLVGQISADTIDGRQFSGIGGHEDF
ncbi:partial putative butyrate:acetyl-CoA coenzyme A-transferase, partial [Myxococcaceae bacterium]